jgi:hypothetical protein
MTKSFCDSRSALLLALALGACASSDEAAVTPDTAAIVLHASTFDREDADHGAHASAATTDGAELDIESYRPAVMSLVKEGLARGQAWDKLVSLCTTAPHRLSGSQGAADAVQWAKQAMEADGLDRVWLEECMVPHWERGRTQRLTIVSPARFADEELSILALGGSIATPAEGLVAPLVEVKSWEALEALGRGAEGMFVFYNRPMDAELISTGAAYGGAVDQRVHGARRASELGGVGAIVRSMTTRLDDYPHTGAMRYGDAEEKVPTAAVSTMGAERLSELLAAGHELVVKLELDCRTLPDALSYNVIGEIRGWEFPDEVVVLGGHLDCWDVGQGAMDDGGGCCQSIEALRLIRAVGLTPRRTVRAVLFMNEENGLRGAKAYYEAHEHEMDKHLLAIESDSGPFTPRGFTTDANPEALAILQDIVELMAETGASQVVPGGGGADVNPMRAGGVTVMGYDPDGQRYFDLHHSAADTLDKLSPREVNLGAACMAAMAYVVADLPVALPRNPTPEN